MFPNLRENQKLIIDLLKSEVERFSVSLDQGQVIFEKYAEIATAEGKKVISGEQVFKLCDTYGFPPELTRVMAYDKGFTIDRDGFETEMEKQRAQSGKKEEAGVTLELPAGIEGKFVGYEALETNSPIIFVQPDEDGVWVVTEKTPFYAESGGQIGDRGWITVGEVMFKVTRLEKVNNVTVAKVESDTSSAKKITLGAQAHSVVDYYSRVNAEKNHTATHLLQAALVAVVGKTIKQAGSLVNEEYLRFDFAAHEALSKEQIAQVEQIVNQKIQENIEVKTFNSTLAKAQEQGVTAFFGEKYNPENVRVVQVPGFSAELCGGTHVRRTGEIGCFKIVSESALATGTRRIVGVTGVEATKLFASTFSTVKTLSEQFKVKMDEVLGAVKKEHEKCGELMKELKQAQKEMIKVRALDWQKLVEPGAIPFLFLVLKGYSADDLKLVCQEVEKHKPGVYFLLSQEEDNNMRFVGYTSKPFTEKANLRALSKDLEACGLRGGGKNDFIQGGGINVHPELVKQTLLKWIKSIC
jgi:alanyl-tRNA synthetase